MAKSINRLLVANRGEIAVRIMRSANALGIETVAVFSEADRGTPHVLFADRAICIGPAQAAQSYLNIDAIMEAAAKTGADAVHPGYGFLAENAAFAAACAAANLTFVGPSVEAIELMGNKREAKVRMLEAGVPCVPGYSGIDQSDQVLIKEAADIGYPLMVKAAAGGGGRGMRLVTAAEELPGSLASARSEAASAFGSDELILERAIIRPRHVEVQVFADTHGNTIHLGERDCSVQRRHQKVIEEAPSPAVDEALRARMGEAAVLTASNIDYTGAGTVEFLLDADGSFYFMEMNTRLQVEHPVTEMITGLDLVDWQLRVARGEALPLTQDEVEFEGHAIEVRLYAEDPTRDFMPQTGEVLVWQPEDTEDLRVDHGLAEGQEISAFYDPMIAKVAAWGDDREDARRRLISGLNETPLLGLRNNKTWLVSCLKHPVFAGGDATTAFIGDHADDLLQADVRPAQALAVVLLALRHAPDTGPWSSTGVMNWPFRIDFGDGEIAGISVDMRDNRDFTVTFADQHTEQLALDQDGELTIDGQLVVANTVINGDTVHLEYDGVSVSATEVLQPDEAGGSGVSDGRLVAPMPGRIVRHATKGDNVSKGDIIVVLEAMKMEHEITAPFDGVLASVAVEVDQQVTGRQMLAQIKAKA
ncbi:MAG: acetyl-CoA carboxylase biotin carboxylase subunit [Alphaproteobacteria bacterium]|jgi:geranyl-CoA carboxylase alpha subunit|nr:acetyl-CoA carboxylase biotin carboxylase subunit [Alphaproteobacteria bacterium]MBT4085287.1 acetyl-CoA carboxylase biotin carboxylase subunit [Alphaproteobacteria bacterium]MBT4544186.1 acetyl-CoA carboxylase biotin carboxylase subunit [Alphaproteobacteria bacterium]MBT7744300.1 acetyl-CoA carboxylase biotin carboxylase subunit [Alphaproteobacteria bacterium]